MNMLVAGVVLWSWIHLMKSVTPGLRQRVINGIGAGPHQGLVALIMVGSLALMIFGWRSILPEYVYAPPVWGRHLNMLLMFIAIFLLGAAHGKSRIKQWVRHPMLTGVVIWAAGHILANGDDRSLVLFGGIGMWALILTFTISRREGLWKKPNEIAGIGREMVSIAVALVIYLLLFAAHGWFTAAPLISH